MEGGGGAVTDRTDAGAGSKTENNGGGQLWCMEYTWCGW